MAAILQPPRGFFSQVELTPARPSAIFRVPTGIPKLFRYLVAMPLPDTPPDGLRVQVQLNASTRSAGAGWMPIETAWAPGTPAQVRSLANFDWDVGSNEYVTVSLELPADGTRITGGYRILGVFQLGPVFSL